MRKLCARNKCWQLRVLWFRCFVFAKRLFRLYETHTYVQLINMVQISKNVFLRNLNALRTHVGMCVFVFFCNSDVLLHETIISVWNDKFFKTAENARNHMFTLFSARAKCGCWDAPRGLSGPVRATRGRNAGTINNTSKHFEVRCASAAHCHTHIHQL